MDWSSSLLDGQGEAQLSSVLCLLVDTATRAAASRHPDWAVILTEKVLVAFAKVLSWLAHDGPDLETGGEGATALKAGVTALLRLYNKVDYRIVNMANCTVAPGGEGAARVPGGSVGGGHRDGRQGGGGAAGGEQGGAGAVSSPVYGVILSQVPTVLDQLGAVPGALLQVNSL